MDYAKKLIEFAEMIENKDLKRKVLDILKDPKISNKNMFYPTSKLEKTPVWIGAHHDYEGGLIEHIYSVTKISLDLADHFEKTYKMNLNKDHIIAGALLHDISKLWILKKSGSSWNFTGSSLDHAVFSAAELYARDFPEEVIHIVHAHGGDMGSSAANPRTPEALIVFYADVLDSTYETMINGPAHQLELLFGKKSEGE